MAVSQSIDSRFFKVAIPLLGLVAIERTLNGSACSPFQKVVRLSVEVTWYGRLFHIQGLATEIIYQLLFPACC